MTCSTFLNQLAALLQAFPKRFLLTLVAIYRLFFKAWLGSSCRFEPSCSSYAQQALQQHGAARGAALAGWRLLRCHPYCNGGHDPVPHPSGLRSRGLFTRFSGTDRP